MDRRALARLSAVAEPFFTAALLLEATKSGGTKYTALAIHRDENGRKQHEAMGFHEGWGTVLTQLVEVHPADHAPLKGAKRLVLVRNRHGGAVRHAEALAAIVLRGLGLEPGGIGIGDGLSADKTPIPGADVAHTLGARARVARRRGRWNLNLTGDDDFIVRRRRRRILRKRRR